MNIHELSPYIRIACPSLIDSHTKIGERIIFDYELLYVDNGHINATIDGKKYNCSKGTFLFLRPGVPHTLEFIGNGSVSQPHIHFDTVYDKLSKKIYISFLPLDKIPKEEYLFIRNDNLPLFTSPILTVSDSGKFNRLFFDIIECYQSKGSWYELECKIKMLQLLQMIISDNTKNLKLEETSPGTTEELSSIKNYIDANFKNIITIESLEKQFHYDRSYISRMFKKYYEIPIMKYYDNLRIEAAKEYLESGMSVSAITKILNVGSIYSFSRFFKNKTGYSPSKHRQTIKNGL